MVSVARGRKVMDKKVLGDPDDRVGIQQLPWRLWNEFLWKHMYPWPRVDVHWVTNRTFYTVPVVHVICKLAQSPIGHPLQHPHYCKHHMMQCGVVGSGKRKGAFTLEAIHYVTLYRYRVTMTLLFIFVGRRNTDPVAGFFKAPQVSNATYLLLYPCRFSPLYKWAERVHSTFGQLTSRAIPECELGGSL